jgi:uncharacterized protein
LHLISTCVQLLTLVATTNFNNLLDPTNSTNSLSYLNIARQGKNQWWRYVCGILLSLAFFIIFGSVVSAIALVAIARVSDPASVGKFITTPSLGRYIITNIPFIFWFLGTVIVVRGIHGRSAWGLVSGTGRLDWQRMGYGFIVWFALMIIPSVLSLWLRPGEYKFHFDLWEWPFLFIATLVLTPIQTSCEEIFFRGYLMQGMGLITRQPLILIVSNGLLFFLPHLGNPEIAHGIVWVSLQYFSIGVFLALITLRDNRLELALGVHAANNITNIFFTTTDSVMGAPALWMIQPNPTTFVDVLALFLYMAIAYYLFFGRTRTKLNE